MTDLALSSLSIKIEDLPSRPKQLGETEQDDVLGGRGYRNPRAFAYYMRRSNSYRRGARYLGSRARQYASVARGYHNRARGYHNAANRFRAIAMRYR